ncbi:ROK family transcriptional regulator [Ideonella azotifigens]|uniref:ROK family transcriptional regulator n=1 Tax=Ideonella azotifigens TaxID=513160 RepID=A0ABN1KLU0_9BURK|nr:ROK family transcriptional regulator [Ideonella azotifigens]MCD2343370.1 ROK family transcriptional regulator [Ideonella azotifigens]
MPALTADRESFAEADAEAATARGGDTRLSTRGSNQGGLRQYNERVVLQAVRLHGAMPGADLARLTGLTAQTVSLISKRLLDEGYLVKGAPVRGKVGQPSVPLSLNPQGAYAVGIKVGRRQMDTLLVDFTGAVQARWSWNYDFPDPDELLAEIGRRLAGIRRKLGPGARERVCGVGIAAPLALGGWQSLLGVAPELAARWAGLDLREAVAQRCEWPVLAMKDTAAACVAELVAGRGRSLHSFLYVFVDTFIGGGLVIDSHLRTGATGNAGAVGSMPLGPAGSGPQGAAGQLLSVASLNTLQQAWAAAALAPALGEQSLQAPWRSVTEAWLAQAAPALAHAIQSAACLLDLDGVIIDGVFDRALLAALMRATEAAMRAHSWEGVTLPPLFEGAVGADAGALGGALLPLHANFAPDRELFLKELTA